jgi:hypothetical protein
MVSSFGLVILVISTIAVYYTGVEYGKSKSLEELIPCPIHSKSSEIIIEPLKTENSPILPLCKTTKVYDHCKLSPYRDDISDSFLHLTETNIQNEVFNNLHHPALSAKWNTLITQKKDFEYSDKLKGI